MEEKSFHYSVSISLLGVEFKIGEVKFYLNENESLISAAMAIKLDFTCQLKGKDTHFVIENNLRNWFARQHPTITNCNALQYDGYIDDIANHESFEVDYEELEEYPLGYTILYTPIV